MKRVAALCLLLGGACVPAHGPSMDPFQDCLGCHSSSGSASHVWTVAGTWAKGTTITVVDQNGKTVTMRGNEVGNFYTAEALAFPLTDCLTCHGPAGMADAKFTAAGTWGSTAGASVQLGGTYTTTANAVGNFVFCAAGNPCTWKGASYGVVAPITISPASPTSVTVNNGVEGMSRLDYGGCNACHCRGGAAEGR